MSKSQWCWPNATQLDIAFDSVEYGLYSTNTSTAWYCWLLDNQCNATFEGDPDIGGYGVFLSFIILGAITTTCGLLKAWTSPEGLRSRFLCWFRGEDRDALLRGSHNPNKWHEFAQALLDPLCDLQIITGAGIVIAALRQGSQMSFYHQSMTADYWWLTMSSLWMANADNRQAVKNGHYSALRLFVREAGIFISLGLAIIFLSYNQWTLDRHWDWLRSGKCFRTLDRSAYGSGWIWIAGLCLNELTCGAAMLSQKVYTAVSSDAKHRKIEGFLIRRVRHYASQASEDAIRFAKHFYVRDVLSFFTNVVAAHATALAVFICFCLRQAWSFWVSGNGTPATTAIFFLAFFLWNFADLVTIKVMNAPLLQPGGSSEDLGTWGFGQVLPMALIASVGFMAVDAYDTVF